MPKLIAMWSGPRNISTAMMRSWESRPDTAVVDEPLYARYLLETGIDHPGRDEIIDADETDLAKIIDTLTTPPPLPTTVFYQKHMTHHLLPGDDLAWLDTLTNALLIRDPREMLPSLLRVLPDADLEATGLPRQLELFERESNRLGKAPPIIDSRDVLEHPRETLTRLCDALEVPFTEAMLNWKPGPRPTDGVWAPHWYAAVEASTSFAPYTPKNETVPDSHRGILDDCIALYDQLAEHRLKPS